jgi:hypothetical protein
MRLNLGCGQRKLAGHVNVDKHGSPDLRHDLEVFPWPWPDGSIEEVLLIHVLEHLGQTPEAFIGIVKELYRVCKPGALVKIAVPHPRHDNFLGDPTHVRPISADVLSLFSKRLNLEWQNSGLPNTPLALYHGVDFEIVENVYVLEPKYRAALAAGELDQDALNTLASERNNVVQEIHVTLRAVK